MKTIEIIIAPDGQTRLQTQGFAGRDCLEATRQLESALGHKSSDRLTSEFYSQATEREQVRRNA